VISQRFCPLEPCIEVATPKSVSQCDKIRRWYSISLLLVPSPGNFGISSFVDMVSRICGRMLGPMCFVSGRLGSRLSSLAAWNVVWTQQVTLDNLKFSWSSVPLVVVVINFQDSLALIQSLLKCCSVGVWFLAHIFALLFNAMTHNALAY